MNNLNNMNIDTFIKKIEILLDNIFLDNMTQNSLTQEYLYLSNFNIEINKLPNTTKIYESIVNYIEVYINNILFTIKKKY